MVRHLFEGIMTRILTNLCAAALLAAPLAHSAAYGQTASAPRTPAASNYGKLPLSFEPNRGQTDASVQFLSRGNGYTVFLEPTAATLVLNKSIASQEATRAAAMKDKPAPMAHEAIRLDLTGANKRAAMTGEKMLPGYVTYMTGTEPSKWQVGLPTYATTRVNDVYPGINLVYYGKGHELEYDFIVSPGAEANEVRLALHGAHPMLESSGELRLQAGAKSQASDVVFRKPVLYQLIDGSRSTAPTPWRPTARSASASAATTACMSW
jgi:hypothetical protein